MSHQTWAIMTLYDFLIFVTLNNACPLTIPPRPYTAVILIQAHYVDYLVFICTSLILVCVKFSKHSLCVPEISTHFLILNMCSSNFHFPLNFLQLTSLARRILSILLENRTRCIESSLNLWVNCPLFTNIYKDWYCVATQFHLLCS